MTFEIWKPPALGQPAGQEYTDAERKIDRKCWNLQTVQEALAAGQLTVELTAGCQEVMLQELGWSSSEVIAFIQRLHKARYLDSEWCLPSKKSHANVPWMAADTYFMGFDRIKGIENQRRDPWVYFKFTVRANTLKLLVFSLHEEHDPK